MTAAVRSVTRQPSKMSCRSCSHGSSAKFLKSSLQRQPAPASPLQPDSQSAGCVQCRPGNNDNKQSAAYPSATSKYALHSKVDSSAAQAAAGRQAVSRSVQCRLGNTTIMCKCYRAHTLLRRRTWTRAAKQKLQQQQAAAGSRRRSSRQARQAGRQAAAGRQTGRQQ